MRLRIYLDVLRVPSVTRLLLSAVVGRMPTGMAGLAIVLLAVLTAVARFPELRSLTGEPSAAAVRTLSVTGGSGTRTNHRPSHGWRGAPRA